MSLGIHPSREEELLDALCKERRDDLMQSTRDKFLCLSRSIEIKALMKLLERPHHDRPYGLPTNWSESGREQIWEYILKFVDEQQDIVNMSETCVLFKQLLQGKYRAVRLCEAVEACVSKRNWMIPPSALMQLRLVCRSANNFINKNIIPGKLSETNSRLEYLIPSLPLRLIATRMQQPRLHRILTTLQIRNVPVGAFPVKKVILRETGGLNLQSLRDSVQRLFELVGTSIISFAYFTEQNSHDAYNILRGWSSLLPNLEEIIVTVYDNQNLQLVKPFEPFPVLPRLKRFWENVGGGFSSSHLGEILRTNRTLEFVKLSRFPENRLDSLMAEGILDHHHQLKMFVYQGNSGLVPFGGRQINWPLTKLYLYLYSPNADTVPAGTFFRFVNQFSATLRLLMACVKLSEEAGDITMMTLPNLVQLQWCLRTDSQPLRFMVPLKKLEHFDIFLPRQSEIGMEALMKHLERFHVPRLFPAMRRIRAGKRDPEDMRTIWEGGKSICPPNAN